MSNYFVILETQLQVTPAQLALHDKNTDAWLAVRGKVYNVTEYLPFHPGGPEELMRGAGKDATALFDQVRYIPVTHSICMDLSHF